MLGHMLTHLGACSQGSLVGCNEGATLLATGPLVGPRVGPGVGPSCSGYKPLGGSQDAPKKTLAIDPQAGGCAKVAEFFDQIFLGGLTPCIQG